MKRPKNKPENAPQDSHRVFLKRAPDGGWRRQWVGRWRVGGKYRDATLCRWEGTPPKKPDGEGDAAFEQSRARAQEMLKDAIRATEEPGMEAAMVERVHAIRYGGRVARVRLDELPARWDALPHKAGLTEGRKARVHSVLGRFVDFMAEHFPKVKDAGALRAEHFKAFLDAVDASGVSARSWNDYLSTLRGVLAKIGWQGAGFREYLANLPMRAVSTIHRRPFSNEELEAVFAAAQSVDPELKPVIVAAACTALRRGDVATLKWDAVDLAEGFVAVKTSKTGEPVEIPIFPPFFDALMPLARNRRPGVPYVFPRVALAYKAEPNSLDRRLKKVLAEAGFTRSRKSAGKYPPAPSPRDALAFADAGMRAERWSDRRREKALEILKRHLKGQPGGTIAAGLGIARGAVSSYLHAVEEVAKVAIVTPPKDETDLKPTLAAIQDGEQRKNRGSLCGWHSFRTTFCTLALENGVPMELLQKITGHRTAEIVLKHYDRRGREAMRKAIGAAMPKAIAGTIQAAKPRKAAVEELEAVPADVAKVARMLANATAKQRKAIEAILSVRR